ncbi:MAG: phospho-N-acetylmuramoyl-pentapeptide-transferase [Scrofimicrobium sp.]
MIGVIGAFTIALVVSIAGTPLLIKYLVQHEYGQFIRQDGPTSHHVKRGTPTMGGLVIILAIVVGVFVGSAINGSWPRYSAWLLMLLLVGLGFIGFLDDFIKISKHRSLGLHAWAKIAGQIAVGTAFAILALVNPNSSGLTPGSMWISFTNNLSINLTFAGIALGVILFVLWVNFLVAAWSNAVNLTDGLDGLATGASIAAFAGYTLIAFWQFSQSCVRVAEPYVGCYATRDPLAIAIICASVVGALIGFLWWNTSPAQIFMGDTGALALGGVFAGVSILTHTEFIAILIGGLYFVILMSDVIQIGSFKLRGKRVFRMAPLHHHFELKGWKEVTIVTRFWIVAALFVFAGVGVFYLEWVAAL